MLMMKKYFKLKNMFSYIIFFFEIEVLGGQNPRILGGVWDPLKMQKKWQKQVAVTLLTLFPPNYIVFKMPFALSASVTQKTPPARFAH